MDQINETQFTGKFLKIIGWLFLAVGLILIPLLIWGIISELTSPSGWGLAYGAFVSILPFAILFFVSGIGFIKLKKWSLYLFSFTALALISCLVVMTVWRLDAIKDTNAWLEGIGETTQSSYTGAFVWPGAVTLLIIIFWAYLFKIKKFLS